MGCTHSVEPDRYVLSKTLGKGAFGAVQAGKHCDTDGPCAVKVVNICADDISNSRERKHAMKQRRSDAKMEVRLWKAIGRHPNIVELFEVYETRDKYFMVMERCAGSLAKRLREDPGYLDRDPGHVLRQMLLGVQACHQVAIVHCDIKLHNFLVGDQSGGTVKLCDFGLAQKLPAIGWLRGECGTASMMSPEMLSKEPYDFGTDAWSCGASMYLALFRELPYPPRRLNASSAKVAVLRGDPPRWLQGARRSRHDAAVPLLRLLLKRRPSDRCTVEQALAHPFLVADERAGAALEPESVIQLRL